MGVTTAKQQEEQDRRVQAHQRTGFAADTLGLLLALHAACAVPLAKGGTPLQGACNRAAAGGSAPLLR